MITEICIKNLRSIKDSGTISLRPIMILLGANSSGKSTFLRSFPLFTQSVDKKLRGPIAWFDTSYVDYGDFKTAKNRFAEAEEGITFCYRITNTESSTRRVHFLQNIERVDDNEFKDAELSFTLQGDNDGTYINYIHIKLEHVDFVFSVNDRKDDVKCTINGQKLDIQERFRFNFNTAFAVLPILVTNAEGDYTAVSTIGSKLISIFKKHCNKKLQNTQRLVNILKCVSINKEEFLKRLKYGDDIKSFQKSIRNWTIHTSEFNLIYNYFLLLKSNSIIERLNNELANFYHTCDYIAPMRAEAGRFYRIQGLQVQSVDPSGSNLLEFIASLTHKEKNSYDDFINGILGVTVDVSMESGMKSLRINSSNGHFNIADVGYGYSQVLPVITKLWHTAYMTSKQKDYFFGYKFRESVKATILMEQPELHLHPAMQAKIADTLIKTIDETRKAGQCAILVVETHSQALINRIGRRIREKKLGVDDVNILLFQKDDNMQNSIIKQISYTNEGQLRDWPYGFFDPLD